MDQSRDRGVDPYLAGLRERSRGRFRDRPRPAPHAVPSESTHSLRARIPRWRRCRRGPSSCRRGPRSRLTEEDSLDLVAAEVDPGGVAAEGHVEGELVQLPSHRQRLARQGRRDRPSSVGTTGSGMTKSGLKQGLEDPDPGPADGGGGAGVGRVGRAALGVGLGAQVAAVLGIQPVQHRRVGQLGMQRVGRGAGEVVVDAAAGLLGAQAAMDQPFVVPGGLHGGVGGAGDLVEDVGGAEGDRAGLGGVLAVGVGRRPAPVGGRSGRRSPAGSGPRPGGLGRRSRGGTTRPGPGRCGGTVGWGHSGRWRWWAGRSGPPARQGSW